MKKLLYLGLIGLLLASRGALWAAEAPAPEEESILTEEEETEMPLDEGTETTE